MDITNKTRIVVAFQAETADYQRQLARATIAAKRELRTIARETKDTTDNVESSNRRLAKAIPVALKKVSRIIGSTNIDHITDAFGRARLAIKLASIELDRPLSTIEQLKSISLDTNFDIEKTTSAYIALARATSDLNLENRQLQDVSSLLIKAVKLGGGSVEEQERKVIQLLEAFKAGAVEGSAFNNVLEESAVLRNLLGGALGFKKDSEFLEFARSGRLNIQSFIGAVKLIGPTVDDAFSRSQRPFSELFTKIESTFGGAIANSKSADKALAEIREALSSVAEFMDSSTFQSGVDALSFDFLDSAVKVRRYKDELSNLFSTLSAMDFSTFEKFKLTADDLGRLVARSFGKSGKSDFLGGFFEPPVGIDGSFERDSIERLIESRKQLIQTVNESAKTDLLVARIPNELDRANTSEPGTAGEQTFEDQRTHAVRELIGTLQALAEKLRDESAAIDENSAAHEKSLDIHQSEQKLRQAGIPITNDARARIEELANSHNRLTAEINNSQASQQAFVNATTEFNGIAKDALGGFVDDLRNGTSAADALENALRRIEDRLIDIALDAVFSSSGGGLFGGVLGGLGGGLFGARDGGAVSRFARGGEVRGPGTSRSDSIPGVGPRGRPLRLSDGEFVMNAEAYRRNPELIRALNAGRAIPGFADGGLIMPNLGNLNMTLRRSGGGRNDIERLLARIADNPPQVSLRNINAFDADEVVTQALSGPAGEKALLNMVRARPAAFRGALGV